MDKSVGALVSQLNSLCQNDCDFNSIRCVFKDLAVLMKSDNHRSILTSNDWNSIESLTPIFQKVLSKDNFESPNLDALAEFFRFLRNSCGGGVAQNHLFILGSTEILNCVKQTLNCFKDKQNAEEVIVLKCCIQLLGNLVCLSLDAKAFVWSYFLEQNFFQCLFEHPDYSVREYSMMVLYNCMTDETAKIVVGTNEGHQILVSLLNSLCKDLVDWGILFLEFILKEESFFQNCYNILPLQSRLLILDIISEQLSSVSGNAYFFVPNSSMNFIKELFIEYAMNIVQICSTERSDMKPEEIVKLLSLLCDASATDIYCEILKSSRNLLEMSLDTLRSVHLLGKSSSNAFSCISNLKSTNASEKNEIECNPSFGFKKNLIRLIGNLCFNCKDNQDTVRKLDGIPLLLDCCCLDARNPFIMQWCILAIRNIMEKNVENQAILAGVTVTGDLVNSALMKELGFEIHKENEKYVLRSLQS